MISSVLLCALCVSVPSALRSFCFSRSRRSQSGYALLMVCFLAAAMMIATWAAVPDLLTQSQREKEEEMIWRGEQYARAVRLYYRKNGRFPQSIEELTEKKTTIRFLRQAYKDPMNKKDGEWRLIYIGPNGQLIGSLKSTGLRGLGGVGLPPTSTGAAAPGGAPSGGQPMFPTTPLPPGSTSSTSFGSGGTGRVFGGNIIGIGSTIAKRSLKVYKGGTTYREWEFIWDPTQDATQPPLIPGGQLGPSGGQPRPGAPPPPAPRQ
jgi:hypothetical protein